MQRYTSNRIGVDLDNVCYPFADVIREYTQQQTGRSWDELPQPAAWDFFLQWGMAEPEYRQLEHKAVQDGVLFRVGNPIDGSRDCLQRLSAAGFEIHFVTARCGIGPDDLAKAHTQAWLAEHDMPHESVVFTRNKQQAAQELELQWAVDDAVHHYEQFCQAGTTAFLFDQPWNRHHNGRRVRGWGDLYRTITRHSS